jgi:hypothetical protein
VPSGDDGLAGRHELVDALALIAVAGLLEQFAP